MPKNWGSKSKRRLGNVCRAWMSVLFSFLQWKVEMKLVAAPSGTGNWHWCPLCSLIGWAWRAPGAWWKTQKWNMPGNLPVSFIPKKWGLMISLAISSKFHMGILCMKNKHSYKEYFASQSTTFGWDLSQRFSISGGSEDGKSPFWSLQ